MNEIFLEEFFTLHQSERGSNEVKKSPPMKKGKQT